MCPFLGHRLQVSDSIPTVGPTFYQLAYTLAVPRGAREAKGGEALVGLHDVSLEGVAVTAVLLYTRHQ